MAKRSSVPGQPGHVVGSPYDRTLSHWLWRGATMLVAATAAGVVFAGPHPQARATDASPARPLVAQQPAAGPSINPVPAGAGRFALRFSSPAGATPQVAPHIETVRSVNAGHGEYVGPLTPPDLLAEAAASPRASSAAGARLAFDRSLTWTGAGMLVVSLTGLIAVGRRRRVW
jgi:hypothetical protein